MSLLPETSMALADWAANRQQGLGAHSGARLKAGGNGQVVGEVKYDLAQHAGLMPNPFSLMEVITGELHINQVVPQHPLRLNVVVHHDPAMKSLPDYLRPVAAYKTVLGEQIRTSIAESLPGIGDRSHLYVVGEPEREELVDYGAEIVEDTDRPEEAALAVAEICGRGLTFVISDFNRLPVEAVPDADFDQTIAVKANHGLELMLPANRGRISLGGIREANTDKPKKLARANEELLIIDVARQARLVQAGLKVARIVFDETFPEGFNPTDADAVLSEAIHYLNRR